MLCKKIYYWFENKGKKFYDSTKCNYLRLPNGIGLTKIGGTIDFYMYGKLKKMDFESEIYIK